MQTDQELMNAYAIHGNGEALGEVLTRHANFMFTVALRVLNNASDAQESVQDACLNAVKSPQRMESDLSVKRWLYTLAFHCAVNRRRARLRDKARKDALHRKSASLRSSTMPDIAPELERAIADLDPELQEVVVLHYYDKMSQSGIAEFLGCSHVAVHKRLRKALDKLQLSLKLAGYATSAVLVTAALASAQPSVAPAALLHTLRSMLPSAVKAAAPAAAAASLSATTSSAATFMTTSGGQLIMQAKTFVAAGVLFAAAGFGGGYLAGELPRSGGDRELLIAGAAPATHPLNADGPQPAATEALGRKVAALEEENRALRETLALAQMNAESTGSEANLQDSFSQLSDNLQHLKDRLGRLSESIPQLERLEAIEAKGEDWKTLFAAEEFSDLMREEAKAGVEERYSLLFDSMRLNAAELETCLALLARRTLAESVWMQQTAKSLAGDTSIDILEVGAMKIRAKRDFEAEIHKTIGDVNYDLFRTFEERLAFQELVDAFAASQPATLQQETKTLMIDVMMKARKGIEKNVSLGSDGFTVNASAYFDALKASNQDIARQLFPVLPQDTYRNFVTFLERQRRKEQIETSLGLKMVQGVQVK